MKSLTICELNLFPSPSHYLLSGDICLSFITSLLISSLWQEAFFHLGKFILTVYSLV